MVAPRHEPVPPRLPPPMPVDSATRHRWRPLAPSPRPTRSEVEKQQDTRAGPTAARPPPPHHRHRWWACGRPRAGTIGQGGDSGAAAPKNGVSSDVEMRPTRLPAQPHGRQTGTDDRRVCNPPPRVVQRRRRGLHARHSAPAHVALTRSSGWVGTVITQPTAILGVDRVRIIHTWGGWRRTALVRGHVASITEGVRQRHCGKSTLSCSRRHDLWLAVFRNIRVPAHQLLSTGISLV